MPRSEDEQLLEKLETAISEIRKRGFKHYIRGSPLCLNVGRPEEQREPCDGCLMWQFVPEELQTRRVASGKLNWTGCEEIPLNEEGDTLDSLSRTAEPRELEAVMLTWMEKTADRLRQSLGGPR